MLLVLLLVVLIGHDYRAADDATAVVDLGGRDDFMFHDVLTDAA